MSRATHLAYVVMRQAGDLTVSQVGGDSDLARVAVLSGGNRLTAAAECRRRLPIASWREQFRGSDMTAHAADHVLGQTRACRLSLDSDGKRQHRAKIGQPLSCRPVPSAPTCPAYLVGAHGDEGPASGQPGTDGVGRFLLATTAGASG